MSQINICGQCRKKFGSVVEYTDHMCDNTGFTPKDPDHLGPGFVAVSEAALKRGEEKKGEKEGS